MMVKIEYDAKKREWTLRNRGLDFEDVALIDWSTAIIMDDARFDYRECRQVVMGLLANRLIIAAFTMRGPNLRVISMRKANMRERKIYDQFDK